MTTDANSGDSANDAGSAPASGATDQSATAERTFTQSELEAILGDRLARERSKFADYDSLKDKASKLDQLEQERLSDIEKATRAAQDAAERARVAEESLRSERLRNAVYSEAVKAGAVDPDAVFALLDKGTLLNEQGEPTNVGDAITALIDAKPYLKAQAPKPKGDIGAGARGTPTAGTFTRAQLRDHDFFEANREAIFAALRDGRVTD